MTKQISRRAFMKLAGAGVAGAALAACQPKTVVVTQVVKETIKETVIVEGTPKVVEKEVTRVTEKIVPAEPPTPEAATVQWGMYSYEPWLIFLKEMFEKYHDDHPNVTVELVTAPWGEYWPKIEAMASAGTPVDVSICEPQYYLPWWERSLLLDLVPIAETVDESIFFPNVACANLYNGDTKFLGCRSGGKVLPSWPGNGFCHVVYLNMSLVKEAGLEYPGQDWTWDDFYEYAIALTKDANGKHPGESGYDKENGDQYGTDSGFAFGYGRLITGWIWHAGGRRYNLEPFECRIMEPEAMAAIDFIYDLAIEKGTSPPPGGFEGIAQPFLTGKIGIHMTGAWNVDTWAKELTDFEWDIARLPIGPGGPDERKSHAGWGNSLCIFKETKNLPAVRKVFVHAMMTKEGCSYFGRAGVPLVRDAVDDEWLNRPNGKHLPPHREIQIVCLEEENGYNTYDVHTPKDADLAEVLGTEMEKLRLERITTKEFALNCCEGFEKVWAEEM